MPAIPPATSFAQNRTYALSGVSDAQHPSLGGVVQHDRVQTVPYGPQNGPFLKLEVQDRVVKSTQTGLLDFYYRLINVDVHPISLVWAFMGDEFSSIAFKKGLAPVTYADFRTDGLGTVAPSLFEEVAYPPHIANAPATWLYYAFHFNTALAPGASSRFMLLSTKLTSFQPDLQLLKFGAAAAITPPGTYEAIVTANCPVAP